MVVLGWVLFLNDLKVYGILDSHGSIIITALLAQPRWLSL